MRVDEVEGYSDGRRLVSDWSKGDIFVGVEYDPGKFNVFSSDGVYKETISTGIAGFLSSCAFNRDKTKLYTTGFSFNLENGVVVFDIAHPHSVLQTIDTGPGQFPQSIIFDAAGNFYVGLLGGDRLIQKYDSTGVLLDVYSVEFDFSNAALIDLARDQCTLFYTVEGRSVKCFDVCKNTQLPDFAELPGDGAALGFRLLSPGDGTGGLLVADASNIKRLDRKGIVVETYDVLGEDFWISLNLDPDGKSFWSGDHSTGNFYHFDIGSGDILGGPFHVGTFYGGLCLFGEVTAVICRPCGVFGMSLFCPFTFCGILGRLLRLCHS
jgi:hypothetical protein